MRRLAPLLLFVAVPAFAGGLRIFNPTAGPAEAVVVCDGVASRQAVAANALVDVAGDDCRASQTGPLLVVHTDTVDDVDVQTLDAAATAECPTPALFLPLTGCRFGSAVAAVNPVDGATYSWTIEGGTLLSGAGSERVLIAIGSGLTLKVTATIASPSCGVRNAAGIMALRDPFTVKSFSAGGAGAAGQSRTITWSYDNGAPIAQVLSGTDFGPVTLSPNARSYTYTPSLYGDKNVVLQASTNTAIAGRTRAAGRGTAAASSCTGVRAEAKYHVDCTTPVVSIDVPAATGVGIDFTACVKLPPGTSAAWTITNATPSTATGDCVTIHPLGGLPVDIHVTVSADTCTATAAKQVQVDAALGCAAPPSAKLSIASSECDKAVITANLVGTPPFSGTWSDGQPFTAADRTIQRTVTNAGDYSIKNFRDALCAGLSNSVTYSPPTATVSTNGATCLTSGGNGTAIVTFTGTPPFVGEWSDSVAFNTTATRLERTIAKPADLTVKWFQDATCPGTVSGHAGFGAQGTADVKLVSPANGCLMIGDPATPFALASVDLVGTPPFTVTWSDGFEQTATASPAQRGFAPTPGATYALTVARARDAYCDLQLLNASVLLAVTRYPAISVPSQMICPGETYDAFLVNPSSSSTISWRIDRGRITAGQGTQKISFVPNSDEQRSVTLYADVADPDACAATASLPVKIFPSAGPIQLSVSPTTINLGESVTVNVSFDLSTTTWVYTNLYDPIFQIVGWCQSGNNHCTFTWTPTVAGTLTIDSYGVPRCDKLNSSHTTATVIVK